MSDKQSPGIFNKIPEQCLYCPRLMGRMALYYSFQETYDDQTRSNNPIKRVQGMLNTYFSYRGFQRDIAEMVPEMRDCEGILKYPAGHDDQIDMCGIMVRREIANQLEAK